jgi:hypothetical protein
VKYGRTNISFIFGEKSYITRGKKMEGSFREELNDGRTFVCMGIGLWKTEGK